MTPDGRKRSIFGIRTIVAGAAAVLTTLIVLGVTGVLERRTRMVLVEEIDARLLSEARGLAVASASSLLTDYPELLLAPIVKKMCVEQPELALVEVVDRSGVVQGHPDVRQIGAAYAPPSDLRALPGTAGRRQDEDLAQNPTMLLVSVPIRDATGRLLGKAVVGMRRSHIDQAVNRVSRQQYVVLAAFLVAGVAASFLLMGVLLRPIGVLRQGIERIGRGEKGVTVTLNDKTEFGLLAEAINDMSGALEKAQGEMVERARLQHEMDLARQIQRSLLPSKQTVAGDFVIDGEQWAAAEVGGDYFDVISLSGGRIGLAMADVSGKGLAGCLVTSMLFSLLRAYSSEHASPAKLLVALDERLGSILQRGAFVTMFYGILDPATGRIVHCSAGHNPTLIHRARDGRTEWIPSKGIPLGAIRGGAIRKTLEDAVVELNPGDVLLQFTDGINETQAPGSDEQFGFDRMEKVVGESAGKGPRVVLEQLHHSVERYRGAKAPDDDETVLVVRREARVTAPSAVSVGSGPLDRLAEAQTRGACLRVPADLGAMEGIGPWVQGAGIPPQHAELLHLALYEVCANIAEHGYGQKPGASMEVWWIPATVGGAFLVRDEGKPFRPDPWKGADLDDPQARKRGRGLGLAIIHKVMARVAYHPGTPAGNITILEWDPRSIPGGTSQEEKELRHAS